MKKIFMIMVLLFSGCAVSMRLDKNPDNRFSILEEKFFTNPQDLTDDEKEFVEWMTESMGEK